MVVELAAADELAAAAEVVVVEAVVPELAAGVVVCAAVTQTELVTAAAVEIDVTVVGMYEV